MSVSPDSVYLDTSVLMNYVQAWVEGDKGSTDIIEANPLQRSIGLAVNSEFSTRCETRKTIYGDLLAFVERQVDGEDEIHPIFEFEPAESEREHPSLNLEDSDIDHLRDLQMRFANIDDDMKLYKLRKYIRSVDSRKRKVDERTELCDERHDDDLVDDIYYEIGNFQDSLVIGQCVAWKQLNEDEPEDHEVLVTLDEEDILSNDTVINGVISDRLSDDYTLEFAHPEDVEI